jgi:hypothetical protein
MDGTFDLKNEAVYRSLVEAIIWCQDREITAVVEETEQIKRQRAMGQQAAELTQRAYANRDRPWNRIFRRNYTESHLWRQGAELFRQASLGSIAPLREQLRTSAIHPHASLAEARMEHEREQIVQSVIVRRSDLVGAPQERSTNTGSDQGRLLLYTPEENLADGAAQYASKGFFDVDNVPPWDTWVAFSHGILLSWVPLQLVGLAEAGIDANPEGCIRWMR